MRPRSIIFCFVMLLASCSSEGKKPRTVLPRIAVVAESLTVKPGTNHVQFPFDVHNKQAANNSKQGVSMYEGVCTALESPRLKGLKEQVEIIVADDGGSPEDAERLAQQLADDPRLIAVIGHGSSGTSKKAAAIYSQFNIPFLLPIATNPNVIHRRPGKRHVDLHTNCYRLPLDDVHQVSALVRMIEELKPKSCALVTDIRASSTDYSAMLSREIERFLTNRSIQYVPLSIKEGDDFGRIPDKFIATATDLVIYVGYEDKAATLFDFMRAAYDKIEQKNRPRILLTDGAKTDSIYFGGFDTYITFPCPNITTYAQKVTADLNVHSFEVFGHDAMLILGSAVLSGRRAGDLSRQTVHNELGSFPESRTPVTHHGLGGQYCFLNGENSKGSYHVYRYDATKKTMAMHSSYDYDLLTAPSGTPPP